MLSFAFVKTPHISLSCKRVQVQYREFIRKWSICKQEKRQPSKKICFVYLRSNDLVNFILHFLCHPKAEGNFHFFVPLYSALQLKVYGNLLVPLHVFCIHSGRSIESSMYLKYVVFEGT